jgi:hypothetical protein
MDEFYLYCSRIYTLIVNTYLKRAYSKYLVFTIRLLCHSHSGISIWVSSFHIDRKHCIVASC